LCCLPSSPQEAGDALQSLDPAGGKLLWWCRGEGDASSPAYGQGLVYFDDGRGGTGMAVDPTGSGNVSATHIRWTITQRGEVLSSPIVVGKYLYRLRTPGFLQCWEMATGKEVYSERLQDISTTWASPIADPKGRLSLLWTNSMCLSVEHDSPQIHQTADSGAKDDYAGSSSRDVWN
jgi:outer membrane protein assembly factor BamB